MEAIQTLITKLQELDKLVGRAPSPLTTFKVGQEIYDLSGSKLKIKSIKEAIITCHTEGGVRFRFKHQEDSLGRFYMMSGRREDLRFVYYFFATKEEGLKASARSRMIRELRSWTKSVDGFIAAHVAPQPPM